MRALLGVAFRVLAVAAAALATVQPVLGSFSFFRPADEVEYDTVHLVVGGILYNIVLVMALVVAFTRLRWRWVLLAVCVAQYVLMHAQLLLGLESRDDPQLLAYHIPVGVLIFGLAYLAVALSFDARFGSTR